MITFPAQLLLSVLTTFPQQIALMETSLIELKR